MGTKHDLSEFAFAKEVVAKFPQIQRDLNELYKKIYPHQGFFAVAHVLDAINDSNEMLTKQYNYYKIVLDKKGSK